MAPCARPPSRLSVGGPGAGPAAPIKALARRPSLSCSGVAEVSVGRVLGGGRAGGRWWVRAIPFCPFLLGPLPRLVGLLAAAGIASSPARSLRERCGPAAWPPLLGSALGGPVPKCSSLGYRPVSRRAAAVPGEVLDEVTRTRRGGGWERGAGVRPWATRGLSGGRDDIFFPVRATVLISHCSSQIVSDAPEGSARCVPRTCGARY